MNNNISNKIKELKNSPIFNMSLSSKELFHSNFWKWLIDLDNNFIKVFFPNFNNEILEVKREEKNRDITIHITENKKLLYVIENKIKSMPTKEQLDKYEEKIHEDKKTFEGILTGLETPNFIKECKNWNFISYKNIGENIKNILNTVKDKINNNFYCQIILEYADMIINLNSVINEISKEVGNQLICEDSKSIKLLKDIRFDDVFKKLKADNFCNYLTQNIKNELQAYINGTGYEIKIWPSFSNGSAIIDVRFIKDDKTINEIHIGIQIQGKQFRRCCQIRGKNVQCKDAYDKYKNAGWLVQFKKDKQISFNGKLSATGMEKEFCKYESGVGDDRYHHVYQYYYITDYSFENLKNNILQDMKYAVEIIKQNKI